MWQAWIGAYLIITLGFAPIAQGLGWMRYMCVPLMIMKNTHPQSSNAILQIGAGADHCVNKHILALGVGLVTLRDGFTFRQHGVGAEHFLAKPFHGVMRKNLVHVLNVAMGTGAIMGYLVILRVLRMSL